MNMKNLLFYIYHFHIYTGLIVLIFESLSVSAINENKNKCHSFFPNTKFYLGTKTPYSYVANIRFNINYPGCFPKRTWSLVRHGTRNPGIGMIESMKTRLTLARENITLKHENGKGQLCNKELSELRTWSPKLDIGEEKLLTHEGEDEMVDLAERFQLRFPKLLPELYSNLTYKFRYTATQRTKKSAQYFTTGLFGRYMARHVWYPDALPKDPILRFYKLCEKWKYEVDKNPETLTELQKFKKSTEALAMRKRVSKRLGYDVVLPFDDIHLMYMTCAFETAWTPRKPSPWCFVFSKEDLEVLEYSEDLKYYWVDGYGHKITYEQACPAIGDMINHFTNTTHPKSVFYFTHSGTLLKVLSFLQLYKDAEPLTSDNFEMNKNRKWRVSKIDVFGTNLAFILYRCGEENKVLTLHQERPVTLPGCPEDDLCPISTILRVYEKSLYPCNFQEMCTYNSSTPKDIVTE